MKRNQNRLWCLFLSAVMLFSLASCGKDGGKSSGDPNLIKLDDYELLYKSACIMENSDGKDALVLTLDFTNTGEESSSYLWNVLESATQNGTELSITTVYTDYETLAAISDSQWEEVAPGATIEVQTAFELLDTTNKVEVSFGTLFGSKSGKLTIDPSTLSRETAGTGGEVSLLDWWNGDWYGWWMMTGCYGYYEDMEGQWWDICGTIDIGEDYMGTVTLWDTDYTKSEPMVSASVSLSESGTGDYGTMTSEGGWFTNIDGEDEFYYDIYLRPWGTYWDDISEEDRPYSYNDWYLPLIDGDASMPDSIGAGAPAGSGTSTGTVSGTVPGGDGIISEEAVQKGWVYMSEVAKDIYNTSYEELVDYFGVEGQFDKEEYSDHMQVNMRYYKWLSSENPNHFLYVNFKEKTPGVFTVSAFNSSGFSASEAEAKYLDIVKAEAAEAERSNIANITMNDFSLEVVNRMNDTSITIKTVMPDSGWSTNNKDMMVENEDPDAFGAGAIWFQLKDSLERLDFYKDSFKNYQEGEDRVIGGITFKCRTYERIGYDWIEYVAQIDDNRALSIGLTDLDCFEGTVPDIILNSMTFQ